MTNSVPVDFVALLVDSGDLDLRPPHPITFSTSVSEQPVTSTEYYLLTGGLLAYHSDTPLDISTLVPLKTKDPGEHLLLLEAEIPSGTQPGEYEIQLLEPSEVVTSFGTVIHPTLAPGTLTITKTVEQGHGFPFPPLRFDAGRRIEGACKVRITDAAGFPGDELTVKLQILAERPVNFLDTYVLFDPRALRVEEVRNAYVDPETGSPIDLDSEVLIINKNRGYIDTRGGRLRYGYLPFPWKDDETLPPGARAITHVGYSPYRFESTGRTASLKYLRPLGEWVDVAEIRLTLLPEARGRGTLSLSFPETMTPLRPQDCAFLPYADRHMTGSVCSDFAVLWTHAPVEWIAGEIEVLGGGEPPPPPEPPVAVDDANIRYALGERVTEDAVPKEFRADPGDELRIPWFFETDVPLWYVRLIVGFDNTALELQGFEVNFIDFDGVAYTERLPPPPGYCAAENTFGQGVDRFAGLFPYLAFLRDERDRVPEDRVFVDVYTVWNSSLEAQRFWEPGISYDVGSLLFRVREGARPGHYPITREFARWLPDECSAPSPEFIDSESGGVPPYDKSDPPEIFLVPAKEVTPAVIVVPGEAGDGTLFIRGDANDDGQVNVSDPVHTLGALFSGTAELPCEDAADANDDGELNLADAVLVLNHLFASATGIPEPYPDAGVDPTEDTLGCERIE